MELWDFMKAYADSFWIQGEFAFEIFEVLMAWFVTIGCGLFFMLILPTIGAAVMYAFKYWHKKE